MRQPPMMDPNDSGQQSRLIAAIVLSIFVIFVFHYTFERPRIEAQKAALEAEQSADQAQAPALAGEDKGDINQTPRDRQVVLSETKRLHISNERLSGTFSTRGNRIDDLQLKGYHQTVERQDLVNLFSPSGAEKPYYAEFGWIAASRNADVVVPDQSTQWTIVNGDTLTPDTPVSLRWDNGGGLVFERTISMDEDYLFEIVERVTNLNDSAVTLYPYQLLSRKGLPEDFLDFFILHQGPIGYTGEDLQELSYMDREDYESDKGWAGFTDKYWFSSIIPPQGQKHGVRFLSAGSDRPAEARHQVDVLGGALTLEPGAVGETDFKLFAGAKELEVLNNYAAQPDMQNLNLAIDFGVLYLITKPLYLALGAFSEAMGHVAWGIILLTVLVRLILFPLNNKAFKSMAAMKIVAPKLKEIQEKHKGDTQTMQVKIMELYQKEKVNPFSGCWPMLLQIPIFFALYKVILLDIDLRHAPFPGWIDDMSVADPTSIFNLFGLLPYEVPSLLMIGAWPCLMGITMMLQRRLNPPPSDPMQARIMGLMPYFMTVILASFSAGLVIYWTWSNLLGVLQQYVIMRRMGADVSLIKGYRASEEDSDDDAEEDVSKDEKSKDTKK